MVVQEAVVVPLLWTQLGVDAQCSLHAGHICNDENIGKCTELTTICEHRGSRQALRLMEMPSLDHPFILRRQSRKHFGRYVYSGLCA